MKVVFVVGTTASGKSAASLQWAHPLGGVIVNCDSIQCYKSVDIGSAKPSSLERSQLRHELFDYVPEGETLTAGEYAKDFFRILEELDLASTKLVFVVGGTGFYFQALEKGMFSVGPANAEKIAQLEDRILKGEASRMWEELKIKDHVAASKISPQDHYRLVRALEMIESHQKGPTQILAEFQQAQKPFPHPLLKLGMKASRDELEVPVRRRTQEMLAKGWLDETRALLARDLQEWAPMKSVGYRECSDYILGKSEAGSVAELEDLIVTSTLQLAKKQRTWFGRDSEIQWLERSSAESQGKALIDAFSLTL